MSSPDITLTSGEASSTDRGEKGIVSAGLFKGNFSKSLNDNIMVHFFVCK